MDFLYLKYSFVLLLSAESVWAVATLATLGRFCINIAFNIGLQYAAEVLPTTIRAQGLSLIHVAGYVSSLLSPYIVLLVRGWLYAKMTVFVCALFCSVVVAMNHDLKKICEELDQVLKQTALKLAHSHTQTLKKSDYTSSSSLGGLWTETTLSGNKLAFTQSRLKNILCSFPFSSPTSNSPITIFILK